MLLYSKLLQNPQVMLSKAFEGMSPSASGAPHTRRSSAGSAMGGGKPSGVPISGTECLQDGVMTCGMDGW